MSEFNSLPSSISHKQLDALMALAKLKNKALDSEVTKKSNEREDFESLLINWSNISNELLNILKRKEPSIIEGRNPSYLMALGALESHLNMAIHAKKVSESEQ